MTNIILKKNILAIIIGASILTQPLIAQSSNTDTVKRGIELHQQNNSYVNSVLNKMDDNGDGEVTVDDFMNRSSELAETVFKRLDSDGDDLILKEEFTTALPIKSNNTNITSNMTSLCNSKIKGLVLNDRQTPEVMFASADRDNNGYISSTEFVTDRMSQAYERFAELERNGNGIIEKDEIAAEVRERQLVAATYKYCINEQVAYYQ